MKSKSIIKTYKYGFVAVLIILLIPAINLRAEEAGASSLNTDNQSYLSELLNRADSEKLYNDPYWHTILHYKKTFTGNYKSLVDDPAFFFAEEGKTDPKKEMDETIKAFFSNPEKDRIHPTAKFSARYGWLTEKLGIDKSRLPYDGDTQFSRFYDEINPSSISLVFPAGYMNSPASMYGHTLLIIESDGGSRLLSRAVNYAAITDETFGPIFAFKGLFGLYKGYYSFLPYYLKIKEYSDGEMRDMWEYELTLTGRERERLMRHVVEMENIYSDYYFIDENCSYNLLFLVEAAKPESEITDAFGVGVEPVDTLRAARDRNLINKKIYRPSLYSRIRFFKSRLNSEERNLVLDICRDGRDVSEIDKLTADEDKKIIMCDLASDYLKFMAVKNDITQEDYRTRFMSVLTERNTLGKYDPAKEIPVPVSPDNSHMSRRIAADTGYGLEGLYSQVSYRQSCHEIMDPDDGYNMNSQIVFGNITGRYYYDDKRLVLQRLDIIDLISLPPTDSFFFNPCYDFKTGFIQNVRDGEKETLSYWIKGASGLSTLITEKVQVYFFAGINSYFSPEYENNTDFMAGGETGLYTILGPWKNHIYGNAYRAPFGEVHTRYSAGASERLQITESVTVSADYSFNKDYSFSWHEFSGRVNFFF